MVQGMMETAGRRETYILQKQNNLIRVSCFTNVSTYIAYHHRRKCSDRRREVNPPVVDLFRRWPVLNNLQVNHITQLETTVIRDGASSPEKLTSMAVGPYIFTKFSPQIAAVYSLGNPISCYESYYKSPRAVRSHV